MPIGFSTSGTLLNQNSRSGRSLESLLGRMASGQRVRVAADDAAGSAIASKLLARSIGQEQAQRNLDDGIALARTADGALAQAVRQHLSARLGVDVEVSLQAPGSLSPLTQVESRQKAIRLIDERFA